MRFVFEVKSLEALYSESTFEVGLYDLDLDRSSKYCPDTATSECFESVSNFLDIESRIFLVCVSLL